jgi:hypothetical protein
MADDLVDLVDLVNEFYAAERPLRMERNRQAQSTYRDRHRSDLRNARRVATALMGLWRIRPAALWSAPSLRTVAEELREFLSKEEMRLLEKEVGKAKGRRRRPPTLPRRGPFAPYRRPAMRV